MRYLTKDLSILCDSPQQKTAEATAGFMLVVFSMGLPALYLAMLVRHRPPLNAAGGREHAAGASGLYETMAFFHNDYAPDLYYWEVVELVRKLVLTAVTVQFAKVQCCSFLRFARVFPEFYIDRRCAVHCRAGLDGASRDRDGGGDRARDSPGALQAVQAAQAHIARALHLRLVRQSALL